MKFHSSLPEGDRNGLSALAADLVDHPDTIHVVVALVDNHHTTILTDTGERVPTVRIRRIEAIRDAEDGRRMRMLLRREWERRTGKVVLPFEMEDEMTRWFGDDGEAGQ